MARLLNQRLFLRFLALGVLSLCFIIVSRSSGDTPLAKAILSQWTPQAKVPTLTTQNQPDSPLTISALRTVSQDGQNLEVSMELINVSKKPIRAYAVKQSVEGDGSGQVIFTSLEANNKPAMGPNQISTNFDTYQMSSVTAEHVIFSVDYVEFSDGTKWGSDSGKSAERSEGLRAGSYVLSHRLLAILDKGNPNDVLDAIDKGAANIEPPTGRSDEWKEGFRFACKSIEERVKRAQKKGQLVQDLRQFSERFTRDE
jgi:hypothetical protein